MEHEHEERAWSMRVLMSAYTCHVMTMLTSHDIVFVISP
jgi:hypothetical protein